MSSTSTLLLHGEAKHPQVLTVDEAWELTREISPRSFVRAQIPGDLQNQYPRNVPVDGPHPRSPWAMLLTDDTGDFRFLAFDFDPKIDPAASVTHAATFCEILNERSIPYVLCASGSPGGRHVWVALHDSVDVENVRHLAQLTKLLFPSLDMSPLSNKTSGMVRPPGAPHRNAPPSTILAGDVESLRDPWVSFDDVAWLVTRIRTQVDADVPLEPHGLPPLDGPVPVDDTGHLHLPGLRSGLPAAARQALNKRIEPGDDASSIAWIILLGAVRAGWRHDDIAKLVSSAPGLEHFRTTADGHQRRPRPISGPSSTNALLARQWDRAIRRVSARGVIHDHTFDERAGDIADHVDRQFDRITATPGRWAGERREQDRDVLEELLLLGLEGVTYEVEASDRTLAIRTGLSRQTVQRALRRLLSDNSWITLAAAGRQRRAHRWLIKPPSLEPEGVDTVGPQACPPPLLSGSERREILLRNLHRERDLVHHNLFTYKAGGLGRERAYAYREFANGCHGGLELSHALGVSTARAEQLIEELTDIPILYGTTSGWVAAGREALDAAAADRGLTGRLDERETRYRFERDLWAWWNAELDWMVAPHRSSQKRRPGRGQLSMLPGATTPLFIPYPRHADGRADHRRARQELRDSRDEIALERVA